MPVDITGALRQALVRGIAERPARIAEGVFEAIQI